MIRYRIVPLKEIICKNNVDNIIERAMKDFSCQRETDLEKFLLNKAIIYEKINYGKTYLIIDDDKLIQKKELAIVAYFTVSQKAVDITNISKKKRRKILGEYPGRDNVPFIPAYLIGQLGRSDSYSTEDMPGDQILSECYNIISKAVNVIGGNLVMLECRGHMFANFYEKQGFKKLYEELSEEGLYTLYKKIST